MFLQSLFPFSIGIIKGCERWNHNTIVVSALPRRRKIQCHKKYFSYLYVLSMLLLLSITIFFVCNLCFSDIEKGFKSSILSFQTIKQSFSVLQEATTEQIMYQTIKNGSIFSNRHRKHHSIDITKYSYQRPNYISVFSIFTLRNHIFKYHYE